MNLGILGIMLVFCWQHENDMLPSGKRLHSYILKMAIEIVSLPIKHGDFP